ncbi:TrbG/VirB9 family P-type conjugative transfer protein [Acetobacter lambici]|uniref:TrbG/VirB9 family P-type conjugative transfer protein n=2 Tax=Acetobacter lambici TaxID=1332824 RepID=A0ABT1F158_9PROT|nr:TrbG/VirB9 family P-type conjugative transfer protein [Acetobacter lambici]MCP1242782.1 TrbG/VirB9 family P-type conjugative transfer protein [Acetobacter lambici]MCP1258952.1 TrbG/VirB9 family P-type conjugative transfer protein [Acetobacter lambici]
MVVTPLFGCGSAENAAPVTVATPGLPSPEHALQDSLDRVHAFMASLNERLDKPALVTGSFPHPADVAPVSTSAGETKTIVQPTHPHLSAIPLIGKGGITWFAFGDGTPTITCRYPDICIVRLDRGETATQTDLSVDDAANWHADLVRGSKGIHEGWAVALSPGVNATKTPLTLKASAHTYRMLLSAQSPSMKTVAFTHSPGEPFSQPEITLKTGLTGTPDFAYHMSGSAPWKPMRVYREAGHTYIQFPPGGITAAPRLIVLSPKAKNTQDYTIVGDSYVIPRAVDDALLIGNEPEAQQIHITHGGTE